MRMRSLRPRASVRAEAWGTYPSSSAARRTRSRVASLMVDPAVADGVDVRGYLHWSALDNYEWGSWRPAFGLIAVDRETFERHPKPSPAWLGRVARSGGDRDRASGLGDRCDDDADGAA